MDRFHAPIAALFREPQSIIRRDILRVRAQYGFKRRDSLLWLVRVKVSFPKQAVPLDYVRGVLQDMPHNTDCEIGVSGIERTASVIEERLEGHISHTGSSHPPPEGGCTRLSIGGEARQ
jgi:hypothetical protein